MLICQVKGSIISTRKNEKLVGCKFLIVEPISHDSTSERSDLPSLAQTSFVAVDNIGAGVGETVLVVLGSGARVAYSAEMPIDAAIVGIVDEGTYQA